MKTLLLDSPEHFIYEWLNPKEDTDHFRFGRIFHMAVLEPERFRDKVVVMPEFTGYTKDGKLSANSKEAKEKRLAWLEEHRGCTFMTSAERDHLTGMLEKLQKWPVVMNLLRQSKPEASFFCTDPITKLLLKARTDLICVDKQVIVDFKSTRSAKPASFLRDIATFRYDIQLAFYKMIVEIVLQTEIKAVALIACEKTPPYSCVVYQLGEPVMKGDNVIDLEESREYLKLGDDWMRHGLSVLQQCVERDLWPSYCNRVVVAKPPNWLQCEPLPLIEF